MKHAPRPRDPSLLVSAALAAFGGLLAVGFALGMPLWSAHHNRPWTTAFVMIGAWGCAALAGCYASFATYFASGDPPERPPRGGIRLPTLRVLEGGGRGEPSRERERDAA